MAYDQKFKNEVADAFLNTPATLQAVAELYKVSSWSVRMWARIRDPHKYMKVKDNRGKPVNTDARKAALLLAQEIVEGRPDIRISELASLCGVANIDIELWREHGFIKLDYYCILCETETKNTQYCKSCLDNKYDYYTRMYGMTYQQCIDMPKACEICGAADRRMHVDHDHETNEYRGVLCSNCNTAIGLAGEKVDTLLGMISYLNRTKKNNK